MENNTYFLLRLTIRIMKLTFYTVLLVALGTQLLWAKGSSGQVLDRVKIDLHANDKSLKEILKDIESQSNIHFTYNDALINGIRHLSIDGTREPVSTILQTLLAGTHLEYIETTHRVIIVQKESVGDESTGATEKELPPAKVRGRVTDEKGEALGGVSIMVKGTSIGTVTGSAGEYSLNIANTDGVVLVFSFTGYETQEIPLSGRVLINLSLKESSSSLKEVVVSYGKQKSHEVTGSVAQVNEADMKDDPVPNVGQRLQGKLAGVQINQNSGTPGAEMSFRIRGAASINAGNSPLIVVDGFPSESGLQMINPDDIESITVLKDASASSLYGSRAANGVLLVTTKQAKIGQKSLEFSSYTGLETVSNHGKPDLMNGEEFAEYKKEYYEDAAQYEGYTGGVPAVYQNPAQYANDPGTNWFNILLRNAVTQKYNLALTSGTKDVQSVNSLNYTRQQGVMLNSWDERFTGRSNTTFHVSDMLTFGVNLSAVGERNQVVPGLDNGRNLIEGAYLLDPTLKYKNADGTYPISFNQPGMFPNPNYYLVLQQTQNLTKQTTLTAQAYGELKLIEGLKLKSSIDIINNNLINKQFTPSTAQGSLFVAPPQPATGAYATSSYTTWLNENTINYQKTIGGKHNIELLAGQSIQRYSDENSNIQGSQFPDDNVSWISAANVRLGNVGADQWGLLSYFGRLNYNYSGKYLVSLNFRKDGSSKFGDNTKYGNFPSASVGWVLSEENFMHDLRPVSFLKIRGSYGKTGNNNIGDYTYLASINTDNYVFSDALTSGRTLSGIGNNNLTWETTDQYDLGLDLELFNNRISFTYDYYHKKTDGLLYGIDIPVQSGFSSITSNIGQFNFWGHEFTVTSRNLNGKLKWNTNFNISFDRNRVIKLGTNNTPIGGTGEAWDDNRTAVGHPIGAFYGYINTGVYMTQQQFDSQPHDVTAMVGTARFKDVSGPTGVPDGVIDDFDRTWIGNPNPKFIYGLTNTFSYKDYDLSITMAGSVGNDIADDAFQSTENLDGVFNVRRGVAHRWRSLDNPGDGVYPRTFSGTTADFRNFTSRQVFNGSYLAVKNITVGYTLPIKRGNSFKSLRAFASLQNALILTKYEGMNPEVGIAGLNGLNQGRDFTAYPITRVYSIGINAKF